MAEVTNLEVFVYFFDVIEKKIKQKFLSSGHYDDFATINRMKILFAMKAVKQEDNCGKDSENEKKGKFSHFS